MIAVDKSEIVNRTLTLSPDISKSFATVMESKQRYLVLIGGSGSGKSQTAVRKILRCLTERNHKFLILRKIGATVRVSVLTLCLEILGKWKIPYTHNKSEGVIFIPMCNSTLIFSGLDDPEKIKSIQGITSEFLEEATEFTENDFKELDRRLRSESKNYEQIIICLNPDEATTGGRWIKKRFVDEGDSLAYVHNSTVDNNPYVKQSYKEVLDNEKDEVQYKIYRLGQWAAAKGLIFTNFKIVEELPRGDQTIYGIDFGYNDPSVVLEAIIAGDTIAIRELLHESGKLNRDIIQCLDDNNVPRHASIYCDSAEPDRIEEIERAGYQCVAPARKDVLMGIDFLMRFNILSHADNDKTNKDFRGYKWHEGRDGKFMDKKKPTHMFSHAPDALRYAVYTHLYQPSILDGDYDFS